MTSDSSGDNAFQYAKTPLHGPMLIEASAGTGKTFSLEKIVLRLIVEEDKKESAVGLDHLLLVTFTNAATSELRMRVRKTLIDVLRTWNTLLQTKTPGSKTDELIKKWFEASEMAESYTDPVQRKEKISAWHERVRTRLQKACHAIDIAAIYTIHAFAQKLLKEFSLSCNGFNERQIIQDTDLETVKTALLDDYLRKNLPTENPALLKEILQYKDYGDAFKELGRERPEYLEKLLVQKLEVKDPKSKKKSSEVSLPLSQEATTWFTQLFKTFPGLLNERLERLGYATHDGMLLELLGYLRKEAGKKQNGETTFIDTIRSRYQAVLIDEFQDTDPVQYEIFRLLFLDHDSCRETPSDKVFFVGDPKQAIYSFRAAELETYLQAKENIRVVKSLSTNYRSTPALIDIFNRFFLSEASFQMPEASFPTQVASHGGTLPLAFKETGSKEPVSLPAFEFWTIPNGDDMVQALKDLNVSSNDIELNAIANDIVSLLSGTINGKKGTVYVYPGSAQERPIKPEDIAVLVRSNAEAQTVVNTLRKHGLRAAILSKESIFSQTEALELLLFLQAALTPKVRRDFNSAAATVFVGYTLDERRDETRAAQLQEILKQTAVDLETYGAYAVLLRLMRETDPNRGFGTIARLLKEKNSRALINYQHLLELIELEQRRTRSLSGLIAWLTQKIAQSSGGEDTEKLRPDTGKSLVNVITIHASKGLEFPVVYLADAKSLKPKIGGKQKRFVFRGKNDTVTQRQLIVYPEKQPIAVHNDTVNRETQETQRLAYVAMTRASERLVLPLVFTLTSKGNYRDCDSNAYLCAFQSDADRGRKDKGKEAVGEIIEFLQSDSEHYKIRRLTSCTKKTFRPQNNASLASLTGKPPQSLERTWTQSSFTTLSKSLVNFHDAGPTPAFLSFPAGTGAGTFLHKVMETAIVRAGTFPKEVLHHDAWLIEHLNRSFDWNLKGTLQVTDSALAPDPAVGITDAGDYETYCRTWLCQTFTRLFHTPLAADETLCDLIANDALTPEISFLGLVGNRAFNPEAVEKAFTGNPDFAFAVNRDEASEGSRAIKQSLYGFLTGQIDLIFKDKDERYWIVDWKSNKIEDPEQKHSRDYFGNYTTEAMEKVMRGANYKLQALCYMTALKRFLCRCYRDEKTALDHMGGALYVFLRGIGQANGRTTGIYRMPMNQTLRDAVNTLDALLTVKEK